MQHLVNELNAEINRLTAARDLLTQSNEWGKKWAKKHALPKVNGVVRHRRPMSAATKAKIARGMKKRWAARHKKAA